MMTVNIECASPDFTILECLQRMNVCVLQHLPVAEGYTCAVFGLVDLLQLASDALLELKKSSTPLTGAPHLTGGAQSSSRASSIILVRYGAKKSDASSSSLRRYTANERRPGLDRNIVNSVGSL